MANVKVKMNPAGAREVMNSSGVQRDLLARANRIKARADGMGSGVYEADVQPGVNRAHARVKTPRGDFKTMASQQKHNTLLKSMDAGRG